MKRMRQFVWLSEGSLESWVGTEQDIEQHPTQHDFVDFFDFNPFLGHVTFEPHAPHMLFVPLPLALLLMVLNIWGGHAGICPTNITHDHHPIVYLMEVDGNGLCVPPSLRHQGRRIWVLHQQKCWGTWEHHLSEGPADPPWHGSCLSDIASKSMWGIAWVTIPEPSSICWHQPHALKRRCLSHWWPP